VIERKKKEEGEAYCWGARGEGKEGKRILLAVAGTLRGKKRKETPC